MCVDLQKIDDLEVWLAYPTNIWVGRDLGRKLKDVGFGNPFKIGTNGNRQQVFERYEKNVCASHPDEQRTLKSSPPSKANLLWMPGNRTMSW